MKREVKNILVGADIEIFLKDIFGRPYSAEGLIGGTKETPKAISDKGHAVQEDNVSAEFNIPAATSGEQMVSDIRFVLDYLSSAVPKGLFLNIVPSAIFSPEQLMTGQAQMFGCEPDYNYYTKKKNPKPDSNTMLRSCGKIACHLIQ